jgi:catechol 2,3-dioxygenase-like lactoylglutathione lyase family enzyme
MRLQHVSIVIPRDGAESARAFYGGLLGLEERPVPPRLDPSSLIWYRAGGGDGELHLMLGDEAPPERAHLCLVAEGDLAGLRARLDDAGVETRDATEIVGRTRFFCHDPFGNLVELATIEEYR